MSTKLTTPLIRNTGLVINDEGVDRGLEIILRHDMNGKPEISFRLKGLRSGHVVSVMDAYDLATRGTGEFTKLTRPVKFQSGLEYKNGSKLTPLHVTIYPDDTLTIRQNGSAASTNLGSVWTRCLMTEAGIEMPKARRKA
jgi:hypothetical protein